MKLSEACWTLLMVGLAVACQREDDEVPVIEPPVSSIVHHNPIIKDKFTADPAAMVHDGAVYLYTGHDEQEIGTEGYLMKDWLVFSSTNLEDWTDHGPALAVSDFSWALRDAWAAHTVERDGKFYWYVSVEHRTVPGKAIGVAVSDSPTGPFSDARGDALITNDMTTAIDSYWDDIDPAVYIDDDGQAYIFWGNTACYYAKLKDNMIELDGEIHEVEGLVNFTEAPHIHKKGDQYYLTYAAEWPERIAYATADSLTGAWKYQGIINDYVENSSTNHQTIIEYEGQSYFIYHNGSLPSGGDYRRSVCIDSLFYRDNGTIAPIVQTDEGVESIR